jgi:hypothetical protein
MRIPTRVVLALVLCLPPAGATATNRHPDDPWSSDVVAAGDLDRDRIGDYVWHESGDLTRVVAFSGRTGATLWTAQVPLRNPAVVPRRVGADGAPGVLLVGSVGGSLTLVHALDATGSGLWTRPVDGPTDSVAYVGPVDLTPGGANDLLFRRYSGSSWYLTVVDGTDGTVRDILGPEEDVSYEVLTVLGDLDGDRRDEIAVTSGEWRENATLTLWSGTGDELAYATIPRSADGDTNELAVVPVGDLTGDGVTDVGVHLPGQNADPQRARPYVSVFSGRGGDLLWSRPGTLILPLGGRGSAARVAVGTPLRNPYYAGYDVRGYDRRGRSLWRAHRLLRVDDGPAGRLSVLPDLNRDGVGEVGLSFAMTKPKIFDSAVIDGRTGRVRRDPVAGMDVAGALDGSGADRLTWATDTWDDTARVTAWRGDASRRLWEVTYDDAVDLSGRWFVVNLNGDRCADLVLASWHSSETVAINGADGEPLWAWDESGTAAVPEVTSRRRYDRTC